MLLFYWSSFLLNLLAFKSKTDQPTPTEACFTTSGELEVLVECLEKYIVPADYYDHFSYSEAQPTEPQREAWFVAVTTLLSTHNNCSSTIVPQVLRHAYSANLFTESQGQSYCVLYERTLNLLTNNYVKGWGFVIVPSSLEGTSRMLHLSAPHPFSDVGTPIQATHLFKGTGAKSLLIPGRMRSAYRAPSACIQPQTNKSVYYMTDPAHNNLEPFFDANRAMWEWQVQQGGCPSSSCAFVQLHAKAKTTCVTDDIFLSAGLANSTWYTDRVDRPIKRLKKQLDLAFNPKSNATPFFTVSLPSDSKCVLAATKNVVGRYLNSQPSSSSHDVCNWESDLNLTQGFFVHIEQAAVARSRAVRGTWIQALNSTFPDSNSNI